MDLQTSSPRRVHFSGVLLDQKSKSPPFPWAWGGGGGPGGGVGGLVTDD